MAQRVKTFKKLDFTIGCDPELFLADHTGKLRASCGLIGGTKEQPQALPQLGDGFAVQEDNVAIEFNIPPAPDAREFVDSVARTMKVLGDGVNSGLNFHIVDLSAASFPKDQLESEAAKVFGCDPDFDAWTGEKNPKPKADDETLRSAGGHVHVGFNKYLLDGKKLIKCMDMYLGIPSVLMDRKGARRRQLYGNPGAYREKPYGFEYRTLSNFWVFHPRLTEWVYEQTKRAVDDAFNDFTNIDAYQNDINAIIKHDDQMAAWLMVKELGLDVVHV